MAVYVKSTAAQVGAASLSSSSSLALTYAQYAARVAADGGTVSDATAAQSAFNFLVSNSVNPAQFVVSPRFGVKQRGGVIQKLYSFDGNDMVPAGSSGDGPFYDATGAYPVSRVAGVSNSKYLRTQAPKPLLGNGATGFCVAMSGHNDVAADSLILNLSAIKDAANNYEALSIGGYNNDFSISRFQCMMADSSYDPDGALSAAYQEIAVMTGGYAAFMGIAMHVNTSTITMSTYRDGTADTTKVASPGLYDYSTHPVRLYFSTTHGGGAISVQRNTRFVELWAVNDCNAAFAQALSNRLGLAY